MNRRYKQIVFLLLLLMLSGCVNKQEHQEVEKIEDKKETEKLEDDIKYTLFSKIDVNNKQPYVFLVNSDENSVYMQFKIYETDNLLWSSKLVEPGKAETLNVYKLLDEGEYELKYLITSYSLIDKSIIKEDVCVNQKINLNKGE